MLSVLIPIYNQDVRSLVADLALQCQKAGINYQILCFDDASTPKYKKTNRQIETIFGVSYIELSSNIGRSRIRNKLGYNAMYDTLLFLDCDSKIVSKKFIKTYLTHIKHHDVIYGGTIYSQRKPRSKKKILHWKYGQKRERLPFDQRLKQPHLSFRSNNFIIKREVFLDHQFDEKIKGYGHEDTLFAISLREQRIRIHHIKNPVKHGGLEKIDVFLEKVKESVRNLVRLERSGQPIETNLTRLYDQLKKWRLLGLANWWLKNNLNLIARKLHGDNPSIYWLDLLKLHTYIDLQASDKKRAGENTDS
jgi:hypothetical protein